MDNLRIIYSEILKGYSILEIPQFSGIFIKHLTSFDIADIDLKYKYYYNKAVQRKLPTEKEKLDYLDKESLWTKNEDEEIKNLESSLITLEKSVIKCLIKSEIDQYKNKISEVKSKISNLKQQKSILLGVTAESYTTKKINDYYLFISLYKKNLQEKYFSEEIFDELEEVDIKILISEYNKVIDNFQNSFLRKIAISSFFLTPFSLSDNDPFKFYGKPIINLTFYQTELFTQGRYFYRIISESHDRITEDLLSDPDKLLEWYNRSENAKKIIDKNPDTMGGTAIVGATKEDLQAMGIDPNSSLDITKEIQKHGGSMNFQEILALHGN